MVLNVVESTHNSPEALAFLRVEMSLCVGGRWTALVKTISGIS